MINLTDHVCFHCQHMNRKDRTVHGRLADQIRKLEKELDEALDKGNFNMITYKSRQRDEAFRRINRLEKYGLMEPFYTRHGKDS